MLPTGITAEYTLLATAMEQRLQQLRGWTLDDVSISALRRPTLRVMEYRIVTQPITPLPLVVSENGTVTAAYTLALHSLAPLPQKYGRDTVYQVRATPDVIIFVPENFTTVVTVRLEANDDYYYEQAHNTTLHHYAECEDEDAFARMRQT
jgi:hypothetical protein